MMPQSYRRPDSREDDRMVYFDYAKSLASRKAPIPWRLVGRLCVVTLARCALAMLIGFGLGLRSFQAYGILALLAGLACAIGVIPILRTQRALSAANFTEVTRGRK
jgi:hypothetical protein